jgi:oligoribonuclease NrnB/cAMP/cGMP phosphodiesterase (DHH superfamily)
MKVTIFSHESDLDGVFSAAIGLIRYPQARTVFLGYGIENFTKMSDFIYSTVNTTKEKGIFIISDLGFNDDFIDICKPSFSCARLNGWQILWIDHHPWSEKAIEAVKPFIEIVLDTSGKKCAADLMYETFLAGHDLASKLASIAHTTDFFTKDQYLAPTSELIRYYHNFPNFYERLSNLAQKSAAGVLWDIEMQSQYNEYVLLREAAKKQVLATIRTKHVKHLRVAFVQSSPFIQTSLFSEEIFQRTQADLAVFYSSESKVSIRRNTDSISCNEISANLYEGGGHEFAAGAVFRSNPGDVESVIQELEEAIIRALEGSEKTATNARLNKTD